MRLNTAPGDRWRSIAKLADTIGEIDMSVESMRRFAAAEPRTLDRLLAYCSELATRGRLSDCLAEIGRLPKMVQNHAAVLHLRGALATQLGDFQTAEPLIRKTIEQAPLTGQNWLALSVIRKFTADDPDIARMETLRHDIKKTPPTSQATFFYALGKALHDTKDFARAFAAYSEGAAQKQLEESYHAAERERFAQKLVADFTSKSLAQLTPSGCDSNRPIFVTGLPRSGTTLVEQILTSHSAVSDGAELNLLRAALIPAGDFSFTGAMAYQNRAKSDDPWGDVARDYLDMLNARFGPHGRIVDKTLNNSRFMGLLLHALPGARVIWLRRNPEDAAISCFRNYFSAPLPWSWSLADIAHYFRTDDALHWHWTTLYPNRILTVPYEELVSEPRAWIEKILAHTGLPEESGVFEPHKQKKRSVLTASVAQVREPISTSQIGAAKAYDEQMKAFRDVYYA